MRQWLLFTASMSLGATLCFLQAPGPGKHQALQFAPRHGTWLVLPSEVVDGDTVKFYWLIEDTARLFRIDAPELNGLTMEAGRASKEHLKKILPMKPIGASFHSRDKYGRALAEFHAEDGSSVNERMIKAGHAKPYP